MSNTSLLHKRILMRNGHVFIIWSLEKRVDFLGAGSVGAQRTDIPTVFSIDLEKEFLKSSGAHFSSKLPKNIDARSIVAVNARVSESGDSLMVHAENEDPQIYLSEKIRDDNFRWLILEVKMTASVDTVTQVFFRHHPEVGYDELRSAREPAKTGENTLYFLIPASEVAGGIRIDPGMVAGVYQIHGLAIRPII